MREGSYAKLVCRAGLGAAGAVCATLTLLDPVADAGPPDHAALIADINPAGRSADTPSTLPRRLTRVGEKVFFVADDGVHGAELWKSDGTAAGTAMVKDINGHPDGSFPEGLANIGGKLYFSADDDDSTTTRHGRELWTSDGTAAGTEMVTDLKSGGGSGGSSQPSNMTDVGGVAFFVARDDQSHGRELWRSDGTEAGTVEVADINGSPASGSSPSALTNVAGTLFFSANDGVDGVELWKSDGTIGNAVQVADIAAGPNTGSDPMELTYVGGTLFFNADDGVNGRELWKSNGSGATMLKAADGGINPGMDASAPASLANVGGTLFFAARDADGKELWKSDGTDGGTDIVKDIRPGIGQSLPSELTDVGGVALFTASEGPGDAELWRSDGTEQGTVRVKDINPSGNSFPSRFVNIGGTLYFQAVDESGGTEPWRSDGTEAGTVRIEDVNPGPDGSGDVGEFGGFVRAANGVILFTADDGSHGEELWGAIPTPDPPPPGGAGPGAGAPDTGAPAITTPIPGIVAADTTAPALSVSGRKKQRSRKRVVVRATCDEICDLAAKGAIRVPRRGASKAARKRRFRLGSVDKRDVEAGRTQRLRLKIKGRRARRALRRGRSKASIRVTATDPAGNVSKPRKFRVTVRRKR